MHWTCRKALRNIAKEGFNYIVDETKKYYPWLQNGKKDLEENIKKAKDEATPVVSSASDKLTKMLSKNYAKAIDSANAVKDAKKKQKALKKKVVRNTVVGSAIGFGAGVAAGYVLVKKSQIKESDYVFDDNQFSLNESVQEKVQEKQQNVQENPLPKYGDYTKEAETSETK